MDDQNRWYIPFNPSEATAFAAPQTGGGLRADQAALQKIGADGASTHYSYAGAGFAQSSAAMSAQTGQSQTRVDIEYGELSPVWEAATKSLIAVYGSNDFILLGYDPALSHAVWKEIFASKLLPRRVFISTSTSFKMAFMKMESANNVEAIFKASDNVKPNDFIIPATYGKGTDPFLDFVWFL